VKNLEPSTTDENSFTYEPFPFPKLIRFFNFFFPKKAGAKEVLTMENLRRFAPYSPFLAIGLLFLMFVMIPVDSIYIKDRSIADCLSALDCIGLFLGLLGFAKWLILALFAKVVKRSPSVALAMTSLVPLWAFGLLSLIHLLGLLFGGVRY